MKPLLGGGCTRRCVTYRTVNTMPYAVPTPMLETNEPMISDKSSNIHGVQFAAISGENLRDCEKA